MGSGTDWYPLKTRLAFRIFPGEIQHIGIGFSAYAFEPGHLIALIVDWLAVEPGPVRDDRTGSWRYGVDSVEAQVSL